MPSNRRSMLVVLVLMVAVPAALVAPTAMADPSEAFSADVLPTCVPAEASVTFTATIRNDAAEQHIGSADVTAPSGFVVTAIVSPPATGTASFDAGTVRLRNLDVAPGASVAVALQVTTPAAGAYSWHDPSKLGAGRIEAKPTPDFTGEGLSLDAGASTLDVFVGTCALALAFAVPPADAEIGAAVTGVDVDPAGAPVAVEVLNGPGGSRVTSSTDPVSLALIPPDGVVGAALTPAVPTVSAADGLAVFDPAQGDGFSIAPQGLGYRLVASSGPGIAPVTSEPFDVVNDGVICEGTGCSGQAGGDGGSVEVTAPDALPGDVIQVALNVEELDCPGYTPLAGTPVVTFSVTGDSVRVVKITVPAAFATRPANQDRVCYGSELAFVDRDGVVTNVGVLPPCPVKTPAVPPCQTLTRVNKHTGAHVITFLAPPGSTRGRT